MPPVSGLQCFVMSHASRVTESGARCLRTQLSSGVCDPLQARDFRLENRRRIGRVLLRVAAKRRFAIDRMSVLPDHVHLILRTVPKMSIEACALALMNNAQHWMTQRFARAGEREG